MAGIDIHNLNFNRGHMKITVKELKSLIREQVEEAKSGLDAKASLRSFAEQILAALDNDEAHTLSTTDFDDAAGALRSLKAKTSASLRDPAARSAAARKAAATRRAIGADTASAIAAGASDRAAVKREMQARMDAGLLPLVVSGFSGTPSSIYYETDESDEVNAYTLKPEHMDTEVTPAQRAKILRGAEPIG